MDIIQKIKDCLKKKKESIVFDLYLKDYDKSNFYFALVFNHHIEAFKVLYVPLDMVHGKCSIEEYFCYQFIFLDAVNHLLQVIHDAEGSYQEEEFRKRKSSLLDSYYIEIHTHVANKDYQFTFTQYIDKEFSFLFDVIATLFEYLPNVVSELCHKLLLEFSEEEIVHYTGSFDFDGDYQKLFTKEVWDSSQDVKVSFLEKMGNRYYAVVSNKLFVLDCFPQQRLLNISSGDLDSLGVEVCAICRNIQEENYHSFYRLQVGDDSYYLCYGIRNNQFDVIPVGYVSCIDVSLLSKKQIKIRNIDSQLENELRRILSSKYEDFKVEEFIHFCKE